MLDSVDPNAIPADAPIVAGYDDGALYAWPASAWDRFTGTKVHITVTGQTLTSQWGDVEWGDMDEAGAADWVRRQVAAGMPRGGVYASLSRLGDVVAACGQVKLWSAHFTFKPHICSEACRPDAPNLPADFPWELVVGTQFANRGAQGENVDISLVRFA
jgi:hypothetical protein